jgi:hypothetical protein
MEAANQRLSPEKLTILTINGFIGGPSTRKEAKQEIRVSG